LQAAQLQVRLDAGVQFRFEASVCAAIPVIKLLREAVKLLPDARLVTWPGLGHGVKPVLDDALDRVVAFLREVAPGEAGPA